VTLRGEDSVTESEGWVFDREIDREGTTVDEPDDDRDSDGAGVGLSYENGSVKVGELTNVFVVISRSRARKSVFVFGIPNPSPTSSSSRCSEYMNPRDEGLAMSPRGDAGTDPKVGVRLAPPELFLPI
jgi:hypothetical protein